MKKIIALLLLAVAFTTQAQDIKWMTYDQAVKAQKKSAKPIFMDVYTDWCGPCKMLDKQTFKDKAVIKYVNTNFYAVKFNAEGNAVINHKGKKYENLQYDAGRQGRNSPHDFGMALKIQGYPTMIVLDTKGDVAKNIVGYRDAVQLLEELKN